MNGSALKRVRAALDALGPAGVAALGVLFFCVPYYFSALRPAERELAAEQLRASGALRTPETREEELRRERGRRQPREPDG